MAEVIDLRTGQVVASYSCTPEEAVRAAYAQFDRHDFNTWGYATRYEVHVGKQTVRCGDYCAKL